MMEITVEFAGEYFELTPGEPFYVGRQGDLELDDNLFLHRHFLEIADKDGLWWLSNVGSRLTATVTDSSGGVNAWLAPGARLPVVFEQTTVVFTAGPVTYELTIHSKGPTFHLDPRENAEDGQSTIGHVPLTARQRLLILALAEPALKRDGTGASEIPSSAQAAARLGWTSTQFNRKLDNVCDKFDRIGLQGMRGGQGKLAMNRKARLVEYAVSSRLVTRDDLAQLDAPIDDLEDDEES
ncbi:hypothetical protein DXT68_02520 [Microbacterium foliorum]|nr:MULTISPECIES: hypothetical protein [Microbacterium]AXL13669.1 hypothetical protein DXT68_02520 [Microbacterium foliorum]KAA0960407.1 hypothetical protein FQ142_15260 [Microbacterium sp. ANT_H45B]KQZ25405.1 hypothetical protein ASD43_02890 [Microbacterium sp. Root553]